MSLPSGNWMVKFSAASRVPLLDPGLLPELCPCVSLSCFPTAWMKEEGEYTSHRKQGFTSKAFTQSQCTTSVQTHTSWFYNISQRWEVFFFYSSTHSRSAMTQRLRCDLKMIWQKGCSSVWILTSCSLFWFQSTHILHKAFFCRHSFRI